ncbi:PilZ domain-containing protein [Aestuariispira insulae]|uniref:PilZ domain-containing protein n=1 Tax=Aestuariispira insulae TaxID=1461337 RepID=A0A3D9HKB1_9PROT|nr:PilZ domain-containing protein [Aestuariispira insulae]RED49904.1 PilZ domain-containing protein [Aestuariispira insulae]
MKRLVRITPTDDRRRDKRMAVEMTAMVGGIPGDVTDLSMAGFGFRTMVPGLEDGEETDAQLHFSDGPLELMVRIVIHEDDDDVYGVVFQGLDRNQFNRIQRAVTNPRHGL